MVDLHGRHTKLPAQHLCDLRCPRADLELRSHIPHALSHDGTHREEAEVGGSLKHRLDRLRDRVKREGVDKVADGRLAQVLARVVPQSVGGDALGHRFKQDTHFKRDGDADAEAGDDPIPILGFLLLLLVLLIVRDHHVVHDRQSHHGRATQEELALDGLGIVRIHVASGGTVEQVQALQASIEEGHCGGQYTD